MPAHPVVARPTLCLAHLRTLALLLFLPSACVEGVELVIDGAPDPATSPQSVGDHGLADAPRSRNVLGSLPCCIKAPYSAWRGDDVAGEKELAGDIVAKELDAVVDAL